MLSDSKTEAGPEAETMTSRPVNLRVVESFNPKSEEKSKAKHDAPRTAPTRKKTRSQASQTSQSLPVDLIEVNRKKHKSSKSSAFDLLNLPFFYIINIELIVSFLMISIYC